MAYCTQSDIEAVYGVTNVAAWSNLENVSVTDGVPVVNASRITAGIDYADSTINDRFRGRRYTVPFQSVPTVVKNWSSTIAGVWLYRSRGFATGQDSAETNRYVALEDNALREMDVYLAGSRRLDLPDNERRPTAPTVVT